MTKPTGLWRTVFFPYLSYLSLFLGMGLISGAIVHMPVSPGRYSLIMFAGVLLFGFASFATDLSRQENLTAGELVQSLLFSLLLSVGVGMISGGIQHFSDNTAYASALIPLGFGVSLFSFVLKNRVKLNVKRVYALIAVFVILVVPIRISLNYIVENSAQQSGGHGH